MKGLCSGLIMANSIWVALVRQHAVSKLEWSKPLEIIKYPDPRLRAPNAKIAVFDDSLLELAKEMIKVMYQ
jgi:peptide deformylase